MIVKLTVLKLWLMAFLFCFAQSITAFAETPIEGMQRTVGRVVSILQASPGNSGGAVVRERRQMIREVLLPRFDFAEMAKRSLGAHWKNQTGRQEEFVAVFSEFVESSYMNTLESYKGEKVVYLRERVEQNLAQVDTQLVPASGEPFSVSYKLHLVGGEWKVYDVVIENISLVNNFRSQFSRILATSSFDELLRKLRAKGSEKSV
jgi:phospholipid transport system substrate-binding protein